MHRKLKQMRKHLVHMRKLMQKDMDKYNQGSDDFTAKPDGNKQRPCDNCRDYAHTDREPRNRVTGPLAWVPQEKVVFGSDAKEERRNRPVVIVQQDHVGFWILGATTNTGRNKLKICCDCPRRENHKTKYDDTDSYVSPKLEKNVNYKLSDSDIIASLSIPLTQRLWDFQENYSRQKFKTTLHE